MNGPKPDKLKEAVGQVCEQLESIREGLSEGSISPLDAAASINTCIKQLTASGSIPSIASTVICPYCGRQAEFVDSVVVYGRSYGMIYLCRPCDAYVGCHKDGKPLGRLANKQLRKWKVDAHNAFDVLWKSGGMSRGGAYKWLAETMGLDQDHAHIGMFDEEQCQKVIRSIAEVLAKTRR